jgi:hypothetical protein
MAADGLQRLALAAEAVGSLHLVNSGHKMEQVGGRLLETENALAEPDPDNLLTAVVIELYWRFAINPQSGLSMLGKLPPRQTRFSIIKARRYKWSRGL